MSALAEAFAMGDLWKFRGSFRVNERVLREI